MKPEDFPESNKTWGGNQPRYLPLPAYSDATETVSRWRLSWWERLCVLFTGRLWLRQMNFGQPLQPQKPQVEYPFVSSSPDPTER